MAFDSLRGRTVLFGGTTIDGTDLGDTWEWTGTTWIQTSEFGPQPRSLASMSFDGTQSTLFGGNQNLAGVLTLKADTWSWDGKFWTQRQDIGPFPRGQAGIAFDSVRKKTVLFGGAGSAAELADTWELSERA